MFNKNLIRTMAAASAAIVMLASFPLSPFASIFSKKSKEAIEDGMYNIYLYDSDLDSEGQTEEAEETGSLSSVKADSGETEFPISSSESATYVLSGNGTLIQAEDLEKMRAKSEEGEEEKAVSSAHPFSLEMRSCTFQESDDHAIQLFHHTGARQQQFFVKKTRGGFYITNTSAGQECSFLSEEEKKGTPSKLSLKARGDASCVWQIKKDGGTFAIVSPSGLYLTGSQYDMAEAELSEEKADKKGQRWLFKKIKISENDAIVDSDDANPYDKRYGKYRGKNIKINIVDSSTGSSIALTQDDIAAIFDRAGTHNEEGRKEEFKKMIKERGKSFEELPASFSFTTHSGAVIGAEGSGLSNEIAEGKIAEEAEEKAEEGEGGDVPVVWKRHYDSLNDVGDYIEVDLTNQHVYAYIGGNLIVDGPCVSGLAGTGRETPAGIYHIYYKQSPAVLKGEGYASPVSFWMPFNGGIGLHDATWRSSFGGNIYTYDGSHGCINLPYDVAKTIYENAYEGLTVICYK